MKNNVLLIGLAIMLSSCGSSKVIKPLPALTPSIKQEKHYHIKLSTSTKIDNYSDPANLNNIISSVPGFTPEHLSSYNFNNSNLSSIVAPVVMNSTTFFAMDEFGFVEAYDLQTRQKKWRYNARPSQDKVKTNGGGLLLDGNTLYATFGNRYVSAISVATGEENWKRLLDDVTRLQPAVDGTKLFVMTVSNKLYALDKNDGVVMWQHDSTPEVITTSGMVAPITHHDKLIVPYSSGELAILKVVDGEEVGSIDLAGDANVMSGFSLVAIDVQPIVQDGYVYATSNRGFLYKMNIDNGVIQWKKDISDIRNMIIAGNSLFITTNAKELAAINTQTGEIGWVTKLVNAEDSSKKQLQPATYLRPLIINNNLYIIDISGKIYTLTPNDGKITSIDSLAKDIISTSVISDKFYAFTKNLKLITK